MIFVQANGAGSKWRYVVAKIALVERGGANGAGGGAGRASCAAGVSGRGTSGEGALRAWVADESEGAFWAAALHNPEVVDEF